MPKMRVVEVFDISIFSRFCLCPKDAQRRRLVEYVIQNATQSVCSLECMSCLPDWRFVHSSTQKIKKILLLYLPYSFSSHNYPLHGGIGIIIQVINTHRTPVTPSIF